MGWATFWASFSKTHLVTLHALLLYGSHFGFWLLQQRREKNY
jgi:hypothetical protein